MCIRLFMHPVQMLSLMYLIIAKKQKIKFFDPPGRRVGHKLFTLIVLDSVSHKDPFTGLERNRFLPSWLTWILFELFGAFLLSFVLAVFSPTNKMYFICSKENMVRKITTENKSWRKTQTWTSSTLILYQQLMYSIFSPSWVFIGVPVSPLLRCYCIFPYSIHFSLEWSPIQVLTMHGPSCLTSVIIRELVFSTWYCSSWLGIAVAVYYTSSTSILHQQHAYFVPAAYVFCANKSTVVFVPAAHVFCTMQQHAYFAPAAYVFCSACILYHQHMCFASATSELHEMQMELAPAAHTFCTCSTLILQQRHMDFATTAHGFYNNST